MSNRIHYLENVVRSTQDVLEFCAYFEDYQSPLKRYEDREDILSSAIDNLKRFISIQSYAYYLVDEDSYDLVPFRFYPYEHKHYISDNVENLIENGTVSWAMRENRAVISFSYDFTYDVLLHSMKTYSKCHGILICFLERHSMSMNSLNSILLTIIMKSATYAFENFNLYNTLDQKNEELNKTVKQLHHEINQRKMVEEELRRSEITYRNIFENTGNPTVIVDSSGLIHLANTQFAVFSKYAKEDVIKRKQISQFLFQQDHGPEIIEQINNPEKKEEHSAVECTFLDKDNSKKTVLVHLFPLGWELHHVISLSDISKIKEAEAELNYQAYHDSLTGLANRAFLEEKLSQLLKRSILNQTFCYAVLFLDVDRLKIINDTMGHDAGDEMIIQVGNKLVRCIRDVDTLARFGGDEFVIILERIQDFRSCETVVQRILQEFEQPIYIYDEEMFVTMSIGVLIGSDEYTDTEEVIRLADLSMYQAKKLGRNRSVVYSKHLEESTSKFKLEQELQKAIQKDEIYINYQPIFNLSDESLYGLEVLARWQHPELGQIPPGDFIPLAEETGLIMSLGKRVLYNAFLQFKKWSQDYLVLKDIYLCINLSVKQLLSHNFINEFKEVADEVGMDFENLHLEITESVFIDDNSQACQVINQLRELGIKISIDDFGTGYSSLKYLNQYSIDLIKLDKELIQEICEQDKSFNIIESMLLLTDKLNIKVIAEGIEQKNQLTMLKDMKCHLGQGFFFAKPQSFESIEAYLQSFN